MEALIILLAEFLLMPILACTVFIGDVIVAVFAILFEVAFGFSSSAKKQEISKTAAIPVKRYSKEIKILRNASLAFFVFIAFVLVVANSFFFEPTVRWVATSINEKTGIKTEFASVKGNLFTGHFVFDELNTSRDIEGKTKFNFSVHSTDIDINIGSLILRPITIEKVIINGIKGNISQQKIDTKPAHDSSGKQKIHTKRDFIIENLQLSNIDLSLSKGGNPLKLAFENIQSAPFRSNYAIFDIFFRSNVTGKINGHDISITTEGKESARKTKWHIPNLPITTVSDYVGTAPIVWFKDGVIDIEVVDEWQLKTKAAIDMDWHLKMQGVHIEIPEDADRLKKIVALPIANYINNKSDVDVQFKLVMNEDKFEGAASLDAAGLWDALVESIAKSIVLHNGQNPEQIKEGVHNKIEDFKGFLDRKRP